jgi:glycosyltransferase involved in cell wall biosynthesis
MKTAIIIPAYNEEQRIGKTLEAYSSYFKKKKSNSFNYEIIVVINNTSDNTEAVVKKYQKKDNHISYLNLKRGGKGYAVQEGFKYALKTKINFLGFVDADLATPPEAFYALIEHAEKHDGVIAGRWRKDSVIPVKQTTLGRIKSSIFNMVVRALFLFPYRDTQCGAKLFTAKAARMLVDNVGMTKWAFDIEVLYVLKREGFRVREIATIWEEKKNTKIELVRDSIEMFLAVVRLRLQHSPWNFFVRAYDALPTQLKIHHKIWK